MNRKIIGASVGTPINPQALMEKAGIDFKADAIVTSASGEVITTTDSAKVKPKNIKLFGKGKQRQLEGNQLFDISKFVSDSQAINNDDGTITLIGYASRKINKLSECCPTIKVGMTITISSTPACTVWFGSKLVPATFEVTQEMIEVGTIGFYGIGATTTDNPLVLSDIMINEGATAKPCEPFTNGEPVPNMNCPQNVECLGESGSIGGKVLAKNLWNNGLASDINNWEIVDNEYYPCFPIYVGKGNTVTAKYNQMLPSDLQTIFTCFTLEKSYLSEKKEWFYHASASQYQNIAVTMTAIDDYIYLWSLKEGINKGDFMKYIGDYLQIELGTEATNYEPYTDQPFTFQTPNGLRGIPLGQTIPDAIKNSPVHMNGVYRDGEQYHIADTENENGKDIQRIGETIFDGDENFVLGGGETDEILPVCIEGDTFGIFRCNAGMCDKFILGNEFTVKVGNFDIRPQVVTQYNLRFYVSKSIATTIDEFKTHISENPITLTHILAEPIVTETDVQCDVVMNYPNTTIVNDEGAYMEVEYVADTKCYIDNKFKELAVALANTNANLL